ncbi:MAG: dynamin family protein, partial [Myxococcota bacterium]
LARAAAALDVGDAEGALDALEGWDRRRAGQRWAEADATLAAQLRRRALRRRWDGPDGVVDLGAAIDAVARFAEAQDMREVLRDTVRLRDDLDRPLLLAVLGEFNAGKSTLINAFIGADVAPMGIVPTTATLNVLRDGAERLVRVVRSDGSTREGGYDALKRLLAEAEAEAEGPRVDRVEIVLPSPTLERVWVLDAPGTNALDPAHERLAREAARRADAVLWVFDAGQAGKLTESAMHERLRAQGRLVVPVLNKRDRLKEGELAEVSGVVEAGFGVPPLPISARRALKARLSEDAEAYADTGFPDLLAHLEAEVFGRARVLKRGAVAGRLAETLDDALALEEARSAEATERASELEARAVALGKAQPGLRIAVEDALKAFERERDAAFDAAAAEVLAFVRPRRSRFARHGVDREDRAFLAEVLERRLAEAVQGCERRLRARLRGELAAAHDDPAALTDAVEDALRGPMAAFWGYQRGVFAGGGLRRFFDEALPRAELEATALARELGRARADVDAELRPALGDAVAELARSLGARLEAARGAHEDAEIRRAQRIAGPLRALREALGELAREPLAGRGGT